MNGGEAVQKKRNEEDLDGISCIKRNTPRQLQINCHFHFLIFPTVSSPSLIRKILVHVHWTFSEKSGPQELVVAATLALKQNFSLIKNQ